MRLSKILSGGIPAVVGHRGARNLAPENTLPAIQSALNLPLSAVELDVEVSSDGQPVVLHQETLAPSGDGSRLELAGMELTRAWTLTRTLDQIKRIDAGTWHSESFAGTKIPHLSEVLSLEWGAKFAFVELKDPFYWADPQSSHSAALVVNAAAPLLGRYLAEGRDIAVLSFSPHVLELCKRVIPDAPRIFAVWTDRRSEPEKVFEIARALTVEAVTLPDFVAVEDAFWVPRLHDIGVQAQVYEVTPDAHELFEHYTPESRRGMWERLVDAKVDSITSDFPDILCDFLGVTDYSPVNEVWGPDSGPNSHRIPAPFFYRTIRPRRI